MGQLSLQESGLNVDAENTMKSKIAGNVDMGQRIQERCRCLNYRDIHSKKL